MAITSVLKNKGFYSGENYLNSIPEGAQFSVDNVVINSDDIVEPRRGFKVLADLQSQAKQLINYKNQILVHYDDAISFLDNQDPANLTVFKSTNNVIKNEISTQLRIEQHKLNEGDEVTFTKTRNFQFPVGDINEFYPFPSGIDEVTKYYVVNIIDVNTVEISTSPASAAISIGIGRATAIYDAIFKELQDGLRVKSIELNSNLYVTTANGIMKIGSLNQYDVTQAGGIPALSILLDLDLTTDSGFFGPSDIAGDDVEVSYRVVWGIRDSNDVLILGRVSERATLQNYTKTSRNVKLTFDVPTGVTTNHFYQVYRTNVLPIEASGDEMRLVYEANWDGFSETIEYVDTVPEDIRDTGAPLYTNAATGEGILKNNDRPPVAKDVAIYKNVAFYANTKTLQRYDLTFLGFDGISEELQPVTISGTITETTFDFGIAHGLNVGDKVAIASTNSVDGVYIVTAKTTNTITFDADFNNFYDTTSVTTTGVFRSYFTISKNVDNVDIFLVGRPIEFSLETFDFAGTADASYFEINSAKDKIPYYFWFAKTTTSADPLVLGKIGIKIDLSDLSPTATNFEVAAKVITALNSSGDFVATSGGLGGEVVFSSATSGSTSFTPTFTAGALVDLDLNKNGITADNQLGFATLSSYISPAQAIDETAKDIVRTINALDNSPVIAYYVSTDVSLPGQMFLEEKSFTNERFSVKANSIAFGNMFNPQIGFEQFSKNSESKNALYYSKLLQPEAVPLLNKFDIGPKDKEILRILALRDSLFILKEEGIYRLTGEDETNFTISLFDNSASLLSPDSAVVLNNQIYCLTTQGVSTISETGVSVISRNFEDIINKITSERYVNFKTATFGASYEADRSYLLATIQEPEDEAATIIYRYNTFTQTWTTWTKNVTCGIVESSRNKLYFGASDVNSIEIERKSITARDYADRQYDRISQAYDQGRLYLDNVLQIEPGDVLVQEQYLTIYDVNALIDQLKRDITIDFDDNIEEMVTTGGADINDKLQEIITELNLKDLSLISISIDQATDVDATSNTFTSVSHGLQNGDYVYYTTPGTPPLGLSNNANYLITQATDDTFKLKSLTNINIDQGLAYGLGVFSNLDVEITLNLKYDINFDTSEILVINHGLSEGDTLTFTTTGVAPDGLTSGTTYEVMDVTTNSFKLRELEIDLLAVGLGLATIKEVYYFTENSTSEIQQKDFNYNIEKLNNSEGVFFDNFSTSEGMEEIDVIVKEVKNSQSYVLIDNDASFTLGNFIHYKAIPCEVIWAYNTFGDPSALKQVRSASLAIESNSLHKMTFEFASDISGDFEGVTFQLDGNGAFGKGFFGNVAFGGDGTAYPLRTLIPKQKQRCRYIKARIFHQTAFYRFALLGISFDYDVTSTRAFRK